jgi:hypothetical protein
MINPILPEEKYNFNVKNNIQSTELSTAIVNNFYLSIAMFLWVGGVDRQRQFLE